MRREDLLRVVVILKILVPEKCFLNHGSHIVGLEHFPQEGQQAQQFFVLVVVVVRQNRDAVVGLQHVTVC